jgi:hypothetical protein
MSVPFSFHVPADERYRVLGPAIAAKYAELSGGSAADAAELEASLAKAMASLAPLAHAGDFDLSFCVASHAIEVTVRHGGQSTVVRHSIPAPKG